MITLLHTARDHCATFDTLRDQIAPHTELVHIVRPDFLARAQAEADQTLADDVAAVVASAPGRVLCTCTTIGPAAQAAGAIRIDTPMMQAAAQVRGPVLLTYCLESTRTPSRDLLHAAMVGNGAINPVHELFLGAFWPLFEAGEHAAFHNAIAGAVKARIADQPDLAVVVLAQASMAGATAFLSDLTVPVFASPELALRAAIG